jgi:ribonucleoside-diphosphate reductase alpha chain
MGVGGKHILSCADGMAKAIETYMKMFEPTSTAVIETKEESHNKKRDFLGSCPECPQCGSAVEFSESCVTCHGCGWSKCG